MTLMPKRRDRPDQPAPAKARVDPNPPEREGWGFGRLIVKKQDYYIVWRRKEFQTEKCAVKRKNKAPTKAILREWRNWQTCRI